MPGFCIEEMSSVDLQDKRKSDVEIRQDRSRSANIASWWSAGIRWIRRRVALATIIIWILFSIHSATVSPNQTFDITLTSIVREYRFDLAAWTVRAAVSKLITNFLHPSPTLSGREGSEHVQAYVDLTTKTQRLERDIERLYASLDQAGQPSQEILEMESQLLTHRQTLRDMHPIVETVLERQIARVAQREGLTTGGVVWPAVLFRFSPLPTYLIISPREEIILSHSEDLEAGLAYTTRELLEEEVDARLQVSSLIENIGGYGTYPTMILEQGSLIWLTNVIAHEWAHNYLVFWPLGMRYADSAEIRTLNETVATIVGDELGARVIETYYPWITPPPLSWEQPPMDEPDLPPEEPMVFEFGPFMRETRLEADRLLSEGKVDVAERYMEERRQVLLQEGYVIRKLNQAYFAFRGLYATAPGAVDPSGPKMEELRRQTTSLREFLLTARWFQKYEDLDAALLDRGVIPGKVEN